LLGFFFLLPFLPLGPSPSSFNLTRSGFLFVGLIVFIFKKYGLERNYAWNAKGELGIGRKTQAQGDNT
jgi:hypothetical protein